MAKPSKKALHTLGYVPAPSLGKATPQKITSRSINVYLRLKHITEDIILLIKYLAFRVVHFRT
jgi:hypothetical protein